MELSNEFRHFKPGIYLHYKGKLYEADHLIRDANDESRVGVHYIGLELDDAKEGPRHLVRTWEDWNAWVHADGTTCETYKNNKCLESQKKVTPRFRYIGPFYKKEMLRFKKQDLL